MKVGLFFGTFNPIHIGHLAIANYLTEFTDLGQVWMVVSPQSPFKKKENLLPEDQRYKMVKMALEEDLPIRATDIEFGLPKPSYTMDTLDYLSQYHPGHQFCLIVGSDNLVHLHQWKNYQALLDRFDLYVYPRPGTDPLDFRERYAFHLVQAPLIEISSSMIRQSIRDGKNMRYFLSSDVYQYIKKMHFYEK